MVDQKSKWHATREARMDELFSGRRYNIVEEKKFDSPQETPLGYKVTSGYVIESTDGEQKFVVGKSLINTLAEKYNALEKPTPKKRGRPRKEPLEQAETWANRDMPNDAYPVTQTGPTYPNPNENQHM